MAVLPITPASLWKSAAQVSRASFWGSAAPPSFALKKKTPKDSRVPFPFEKNLFQASKRPPTQKKKKRLRTIYCLYLYIEVST